jgi:NAD-dependent histone deacetylase SIR2
LPDYVHKSEFSDLKDFRSYDGLYKGQHDQKQPRIKNMRSLFESTVYGDPALKAQFYTLVANMKATIDTSSPSPTHQFIYQLNRAGRLLRWYTQNIDGLEFKTFLGDMEVVSVPHIPDPAKIVRLHGDIQ